MRLWGHVRLPAYCPVTLVRPAGPLSWLPPCRLNYRLNDACHDTITSKCGDACSSQGVEQPCGGTVLRCLTDKLDEITDEDCKKEVFYFIKMEVRDFRNDVILAEACRTDVDNFCADVEPGEPWLVWQGSLLGACILAAELGIMASGACCMPAMALSTHRCAQCRLRASSWQCQHLDCSLLHVLAMFGQLACEQYEFGSSMQQASLADWAPAFSRQAHH